MLEEGSSKTEIRKNKGAPNPRRHRSDERRVPGLLDQIERLCPQEHIKESDVNCSG